MSDENEIIVVKNEMTVSSDDVTRVGKHLQIIKQFVSQEMKEGIDRDFAIIPGTRTKSLLQPGAQKLMRLFNLGVRYSETEKIFDRFEGFALFSYKAEVYHLGTGIVIAECEGTANSQEKKYKRSEVCDILNTLKKMAQKRAMVGAVITAVGASDYFSQDEDEVSYQQRGHKKAEVNISTNNQSLGEYEIPFGTKYKGMKLKDVPNDGLKNFLDWICKQNSNPQGNVKEFIDKARDYLRGQA